MSLTPVSAGAEVDELLEDEADADEVDEELPFPQAANARQVAAAHTAAAPRIIFLPIAVVLRFRIHHRVTVRMYLSV